MLHCKSLAVLLKARLHQLQATNEQLDSHITTADRDLAATSSELADAKLSLKVKLEEQQNQFRAIEEEQYSEWEKRVRSSAAHAMICMGQSTELCCLASHSMTFLFKTILQLAPACRANHPMSGSTMSA